MSLITCPECGTKLRLKVELPAGKRVRCSKCSAAFVPAQEVPADLEVVDDAKANPDPPARAPAKKPAAAPKAASADFEVIDDSEPDVDRPRPAAAKKPGAARKAVSPDFEVIDDGEPDAQPPARADAKKAATPRKAANAEPDVWVEDEVEEDVEEPPVRRRRRPPKPIRRRSNLPLILGLSIGGGLLLLAAVTGVVLFLLLSGPSKNYKQHEAISKETVKLLTDLIVALESVKDPGSAKVAATKIMTICDQLEETASRYQRLPKLSTEEQQRLTKQVEADVAPLRPRLANAALQAGKNSAGEQSFLASANRLKEVGERLQRLGL